MEAQLRARVSFYLHAVLITQPDWLFQLADRYSSLTKWKTNCMNGKQCIFQVIAAFDSSGINMTIGLDEANAR